MSEPSLYTQVEKIITERIKPAVQLDGGDMELVSVDEQTGIVAVRLRGACVGCPMSHITLSLGIERQLLEALPQLHGVELVEDEL